MCDRERMKKRGRPRVRPKPASPYKKVGQGTPLRSQGRELVINVRQYFQSENENNGPILCVKKVVERTAAALKINKNTVTSIWKQKNEKLLEGDDTILDTPNKKRAINKRKTNIDTFQQSAIRRHIYSYYTRKEYPTLDKLLVSLKNESLFRGSRSSLYIVLRRMGFIYKKINKRQILLERNDVVAKRCAFLREIRKHNVDDIVWLDETWVNVGHCPIKAWTDNTSEGSMAVPLGKGERLILLHAGMSSGFVPNCMLLFTSKSTTDYHEEMCHETFMKWFSESLLPNLHKPCIIVMDNASYHSKVLNKAPTTNTIKQEIRYWLERNNINYDEDMKKAELLDLVNFNKIPKQYIIDELAKQYGHKVVRIPPYHCHFNSIEYVWAQVKGYVAKNNKKFTLTEIKRLTQEGIHSVTEQDWKRIVEHTKKEIDDAWTSEGLVEDAVESIIISLNDEDSDSSSDEEESYSRDILPEDEFGHDIQYPDQDIYVSDNDDDENQDNADNVGLSGVFPLPPENEKILSFDEF